MKALLHALSFTFLLICCSSFAFTQFPPDEAMFLIPIQEFDNASSITSTGLNVYQRLPEHFLVGGRRASLLQLQRSGVAANIVDEQPWSESYAVVTSLQQSKLQNEYSWCGVRVLFGKDDYQLVKGSRESFEALRASGLKVMVINKTTVPAGTSRTIAPAERSVLRDSFISSIIARVADTLIHDRIEGLQSFGTRHYAQANRENVFQWLSDRFIDAGFADVAFDSFQFNGTWQKNVVATMPGVVSGEIIVGGHVDSYSNNLSQAPGADDNASGTAVALEMARVLQSIGYTPYHTLRFIGFAAEEAGLIGSGVYAQRARAANRDIKVMMNYDMVANRNLTQTDHDVYIVWYSGSQAFSDLHAATMRAYTTLNPIFTSSYRSGSDSYSFYQQNYRSVFCIERDFSPYYHSPNDLLQYLDMNYAGDIARSGLAMLLTLDQMPPAVAGLHIRDVGDGQSLLVEWDSVFVPDAALYKIQWGNSSGAYDSSITQRTRSFVINNLNEGEGCYVGVSIIDLTGREGVIEERSAVPLTVPLPPAGVALQNLPEAINISWRRNTELDISGYNLYRSSDLGANFTRVNAATISDTSWSDSVDFGLYQYYVTAVDYALNQSAPSDTVEGSPLDDVNGTSPGLPSAAKLFQNYPNPFNASTTIRYEVPRSGHVVLEVFNLLGQRVSVLVSEGQQPGEYAVDWQADDLPTGVYHCRLQAGGGAIVRTMMLLK